MSNQAAIAKLAKWMGDKVRLSQSSWRPDRYEVLKPRHGGNYWCLWDPFTNIADAWMLVERAAKLCETGNEKVSHTIMDNCAHGIFFQHFASEAAAAISNAVLEVIDAWPEAS